MNIKETILCVIGVFLGTSISLFIYPFTIHEAGLLTALSCLIMLTLAFDPFRLGWRLEEGL